MSFKITKCERSDENEIVKLQNSDHISPTKKYLIVDCHTVSKNFFSFRRLRRCPKSSRLVCMMVTFIFLLVICGIFIDISKSVIEREYGVLGDFIVDTSNCRIPNISPFSKEAMKVFKPVRYQNCSTRTPLVSLQQFRDSDSKILLIHDNEKNAYMSFWHKNFECCYKNVYRSGINETADMNVEISSSCRRFNTRHQLDESDEFILIECVGYREFFGFKPSTNIFRDAFAIIRRKESVKEKLKRRRLSEDRPTSPEKFNVFFLGIDSISRLNLIRALPKTYKHVESTGWLEFRGYNKMEDNTFPNLMAILTGHNLSAISDICDWRRFGELENCEFMWNLYDKAGYVTAYAEDESKISTFNYFRTGFTKPPTDYYFRPLAIAAEDYLEHIKWNSMVVCLGRKNYADFIYDYGVDLATTFPDDPKFGFFWTNSFSHEDLSFTSSMDEKVKGYLKQWEEAGILNSSIVFFFSDHGMRFGSIRKYFTGWLEERLPFLYIWLPPSFREKYPEIVKNLKINRDRLISPYDVHVTLKDILKMSGGYEGDLSANSCPSCQSLFVEIPTNRSCEDAGVDKHWCTCTEYLMTDAKSKEVKNAVNYVLNDLNDDLKNFPKCAQLRLHSIHSARKSSRQQDFLISFKVKPSDAEFEVTVRCEDTSCENLKVVGSISRINRYGDQSSCINDAMMRKYCYCT